MSAAAAKQLSHKRKGKDEAIRVVFSNHMQLLRIDRVLNWVKRILHAVV